MIVVDASVATKWLLAEPGAQAALQLLAGPDPLIAPDLARIEVAAAITRKVRLGQIPQAQARSAFGFWDRILSQRILALSPDRWDWADAFRIALTIAHPYQDCLYLALAIRAGASLVTADAKFAARASALYPQIRPLVP